jgi:hypothetical protein
VPATCFDGIKNENETGIDCGGPCKKKCSLITLMGSVVNGPLDAGKNIFKNMFSNLVNTSISIGVFTFILGGVVVFMIFSRKNQRMQKLAKKFEEKLQKDTDRTTAANNSEQ